MKRIIIKIFLIGLMVLIISGLTLHLHSVYKRHQIMNNFEKEPINQYETLEVDGLSMAYRMKGDRDAPTLVMIHGFLGSSYDFRKIMEPLSEDYHLIAVDMIGFGHSEKPSDFTYTEPNQAHHIQMLLDTLNIDNYALLGHSMGTRVALTLNDIDQDKVNKLILLSPAGTQNRETSTTPPKIFYEYLFKNYTLQRLGFRSVHDQTDYKSATYFDPMFYFTSQIPSSVLRQMNERDSTSDWDEIIENTRNETLIIIGNNDTWTPLAISEAYEESLLNATLQTIAETGHMPMIESSAEVLALIQSLLR